MAAKEVAYWAIIALIGYFVYTQTVKRSSRKLPPGPKSLPLLGNIRDLPPNGVPEHEHWLQHKDSYGGISSVTVMGMTLVIIHDQTIAHDLLEKQASKTSGRPTMVMANKLCGYESIVLCQGYTPTFKRYRKFLHQQFGTKAAAAQFRGAQEVEVIRQLVRALNDPTKWIDHFKTTAGATVLKMAYGYAIDHDKPDALVHLVDKMMTEFSLAASPMSWIVDIIPALQYLPEGFPGTSFHKTARKWRRSIQSTAYIPYRFVQAQMATFTHRPSYVSKLIQYFEQESDNISEDDEQTIIWTAASLYGAAADTTVIALTAFTLAMILFPNVQSKAQEEIDRVVGASRLPNFDDQENLPYVDALVKESIRWWPIAPMGFPHTVTEDIGYNGMHIPKDSMILPAVWWFLHNPEVYGSPDTFNPDRFLPPHNQPDPRPAAFGYGRRACAGQYVAESSLYLHIAQSLSVFKFCKAVDKNGQEVDQDVKIKPGVLAYPTNFDVNVRPRSEKHVQLIRGLEKQYPWEPSDADFLEGVEDVPLT